VPTAPATAPTSALRLSDTVEITLTVEGPPPLRVEWPTELLAPASASAWQITPVGTATLSPDGTTWAQKFRLSPFVPGEALPVTFNPVRVNGTEVTPTSLTFKVETALRNPTAADARPVTGLEPLPDPPPSEPPFVLAGGTLTLALVAVLVTVLVVARHRKPKPVSPGTWVRERIAALQAARLHGGLSAAGFVAELAAAFRGYLTRRFGLRSEQKTTAELVSATSGVWDADTRGRVEELLNACDAVKFAGTVPTPTDCDALVEQAGRLITRWEDASGAT
jgi:hypothetical protein